MKRLLFAGMIFFALPVDVRTQTKAGKTDTMKHAVYYPLPASAQTAAATGQDHFSAKEKQGRSRVKATDKPAWIPPSQNNRMNRSSKELMKLRVTEGE
ncbi:MAG: hypothetical protein U0V75_13815 [Ferruginibacter sp.]